MMYIPKADWPVMDFKSVVIILYYNSCYIHLGFNLEVYIVDNFVFKVIYNKHLLYYECTRSIRALSYWV